MRRDAALFILLAGGAALGVIALARPDLLHGGRGASLLYWVLLLAFVGSAVWARRSLDGAAALRDAVIWLAIIVVLVGAYRMWQAWT